MVNEENAQPSPATFAAASMSDAVAAIGLALLANVPLVLRGAPGTGKTSLLRSIAQALSWPIHAMSATIQDPTDFAGLTYLSQHGSLDMHTMRAPLQWAISLAEEARNNDGDAILFFDDISYAPPGVQNALLQIVQERRVGDFQLPFGVRCAAAINPSDTAATMRTLTAPLANRMVHITWAPDAQSWAEGFVSYWRHTLLTLPRGWSQRFDATRASIAEFIRTRPEMLHNEPADERAQGGPWASARTWEMLGRLMAACDAADANLKVRWLLASGAVGEAAAAEFLRWERHPNAAKELRVAPASHNGGPAGRDTSGIAAL